MYSTTYNVTNCCNVRSCVFFLIGGKQAALSSSVQNHNVYMCLSPGTGQPVSCSRPSLQRLPGTQRLQREVLQRTEQEMHQGRQQTRRQRRVNRPTDLNMKRLYRSGQKNQMDVVVSGLKDGNKLMTYLLQFSFFKSFSLF